MGELEASFVYITNFRIARMGCVCVYTPVRQLARMVCVCVHSSEAAFVSCHSFWSGLFSVVGVYEY